MRGGIAGEPCGAAPLRFLSGIDFPFGEPSQDLLTPGQTLTL